MTEVSFPQDPRGYLTRGVFRSLRLTDPMLSPGWDVWALQTALGALGHEVAVDGAYGPKTEGAVREVQERLGIAVDGIVGLETYRVTANEIAVPIRRKYGIVRGLIYGQLHHESLFIHGNYSPQRSDGHYDNGVAQHNGRYTPITRGMDVPWSIEDLGSELKEQFIRYRNTTKGTVRQCWEWACAHWNSPERADALAYGHDMTDAARRQIEAYIADCCAFVHWP